MGPDDNGVPHVSPQLRDMGTTEAEEWVWTWTGCPMSRRSCETWEPQKQEGWVWTWMGFSPSLRDVGTRPAWRVDE
jgi:hypothetical protein